MNDQEFKERAYADPFDESADFLAALKQSPERQALLAEIKQFESNITSTFNSVQASESLKQKLLAPDAQLQGSSLASPLTDSEAANASYFWKRTLPIVASLIIVMSIAISFYSEKLNPIELALQQEVFDHIYEQIDFLGADDNVPVSQVNQMMASSLGSQFQQTVETSQLSIKKANDCLIANEDAIHIVMQGTQGAVTVMLIPNSPVKNEFTISDERFSGIITPTPVGNLIVVGEKQEPILELSNLLASNINW